MATRDARAPSMLCVLVLALGLVPAAEPARADEPTPPAIASFSPPNGGVGDRVTIAGAGFTGAFAVIVGSRTAAFTVDSDAQITATVPEDAVTGPIRVQAPGGEVSSALPFVVVPSVRTFSPSGGPPGTSVVIGGRNLTSATRVTFGGAAATTFRVDTRGRRIQARVPPGARSGPIGVTTPAGPVVSRGHFIVEEAPTPTIRGFAPGRGGPGARVRIFGANFRVPDDRRAIALGGGVAAQAGGDLVSAVRFRGLDDRDRPARFVVDSPTQITAVVPPGAASGRVLLVTSGGPVPSPGRFVVPGTPPVCGPAAAAIAPADGCQDPELSFASQRPDQFIVSVPEGDAGTRDARFVVELSPATRAPVTVLFTTREDGSGEQRARQGEDYARTAGFLVFPPGTTRREIRVPIRGDTKVEEDEFFEVALSDPVNATIRISGVVGEIVNDDGPMLSIGDARVAEGDPVRFTSDPRTPMSFTVKLSQPSRQQVSVEYFTCISGILAFPCPAATAGGEDIESFSAKLVFAPGETEKTIVVFVVPDDAIEDDETFLLSLDEARGATIRDPVAVGTIVDDDHPTEEVM